MFGFRSRRELESARRITRNKLSPADPKQIGGIPALICRTGSGGIPARSGSTAGKASDVRVVFIKPDGSMSTSSRQITVYNPFALPVAASVYITCKFVNAGYWIVDAEDCS